MNAERTQRAVRQVREAVRLLELRDEPEDFGVLLLLRESLLVLGMDEVELRQRSLL